MNSHDISKEHIIRSEDQRTCFLVYSTRESHISKVIERLSDLLSNEFNLSVIKLDEARVAGTPLLPDILKYTKECDMCIVILDGLRPNVLLELGMILANGIPCVILIERTAKINVSSLISDTGRRPRSVPKIKIDVLKHISDISNTSWNEYLLNDDINFRSLIRAEIKKLWPAIQKKQPHSHQGYSKKVISLIRQIDNSKQLSLKQHKQLIFEIHKKMKLFPKDQWGHIIFHIARSLVRKNEKQTAFREVVAGLALCPNYDQLLGQKGCILFELGQKKEGLKVLKAAFLKNPRSRYLLKVYLQTLNLDNKPKEVLRILAHLTYESLLINNLIPIKSHALFLNGQIEDSLKLLVEMYEYDSNKWAIQKAMTLLADEKHGTLPKDLIEQIDRNVQKAIKNKHVDCYRCFIRGCIDIGLMDLARALLFQWLKSGEKKDVELSNELAFELIEVGEYKMAQSILRSAIKTFPNDSYLNATWGLYKLQVEKKLEVGKCFYLKAIKLSPQDVPLKRMYLYQLGRFYHHRGNKIQAKKNYSLALQEQTDFLQSKIQDALNSLSMPKQMRHSHHSSNQRGITSLKL
jgi:tetratricopeptide (TPR) repeat protein